MLAKLDLSLAQLSPSLSSHHSKPCTTKPAVIIIMMTGADAIQEKLDFNDDSQLLVDKGGSRGIYKNELDSQLARVDDKAKYVAVTWMVECKVKGYDELYDGGISARQIGTNR